ncbi:hypothetical protein [Brachyspira pilosicoli]|uniref:Lipoprotein n=1 Tax=Brachyspira pilosicoli (strain ATCC BAA-1826 / 95/1000) TaxID=759914 RepID=D8IFE6_BRAP9|nr:hypothetical protein [Brachyspira pilosicoli]ADK31869.1 conserved hypothetical protein [Brachyspira pilosicoli 95/1000]
MNNKIPLLILIVIAFIISCSNNNTNPNNSQGVKEKTELGNVETPTDNGGTSDNNGNTDNNNPTDNGNNSGNNGNNTEEKPPLPPLDNYLHMYTGTAKYYVKTLDDAVVTKASDENIYVEIYDDYIVVSSGATFFFDTIEKPSEKEYKSTEYYNDATYNLYLKINNDNTAYLRLSIRDAHYSYHFDADSLPEFKNN